MPRLLLDNVSVDFPIYDASHRSMRRALLSMSIGGAIFRRSRHQVAVRALDGISLDLRDGARVGLIGHNGAGKSTLLRVLAGLCEPSGGGVLIDGRVGTLLSLSSILDPEMTGYENIDTAAVLLELPRARRRSLPEEVADFTELGDFLALPVRTYSSGMQLRLSLALMTAQEPQILLIDEVMGAGDAQFFAKAARRVGAFRDRTSIMVAASHSTEQIRRLCDQAVWLEHGRIVRVGPVDEVLAAYGASITAVPADA